MKWLPEIYRRRSSAFMAVAPSRLLFGIIPWYSFLIVLGAAAAICLAAREEKRAGLKKDTALDFALIALPCGIVGARVYYVAFSWSQFQDDPVSVLRIWEGGIAIYGAVIAGLAAAWIFSRKRNISFRTLCDLFAPGLVLAQAIGRWGNYFNQEAYGAAIQNPALHFFPFGVLIQSESGLQWHMATFFYESAWNLLVFVFLMIARRKWFKIHGDVISFYTLLYACGRLVIEDFRSDSLYASSNVRVSQLLSVVLCMFILICYIRCFRREASFRSAYVRIPCTLALSADSALCLWLINLIPYEASTMLVRFVILLTCSIINMLALFVLYGRCAEGELIYADNKN